MMTFDIVPQNGWSPLMVASKKGHLGIVKTFIETGADVNQANQVLFSTYTYLCVAHIHIVLCSILSNLITTHAIPWPFVIQ